MSATALKKIYNPATGTYYEVHTRMAKGENKTLMKKWAEAIKKRRK